MMSKKPPIINCHTHIFTGDNVPPYLARTFIPWPFYYLIPVSFLVRVFRFWYRYPNEWQFKPWYKTFLEFKYKIWAVIHRSRITDVASKILTFILTIIIFRIIYTWLCQAGLTPDSFDDEIQAFYNLSFVQKFLIIPDSTFEKIMLVLFYCAIFKAGRNLLFFILERCWSFFKVLPGKHTQELAERYIRLGRFSFNKQQADVYSRLKQQYPPGTGFIILPMDMEYMDAGKPGSEFRYAEQMESLRKIKENDAEERCFFPFVFADPRRLAEEGAAHFNYSIDSGKVILGPCFIKDYIEDYKFSGFKIYPALGYYPFDEKLLPLWKYAADNGFPVLTHCIRGTIYYRGMKKAAWDRHPVFEQSNGNDIYGPLLLLEKKNIDFINNFTHPMNFLCLLDERLLRKLVEKASDDKIRELFGYTDADTELKYNLRQLKICFGHYGGDDEWKKYMESDRYNFANLIIKKPDEGINFFKKENGEASPGKPEQIWRYVDWYSIISSMMLQYPNVYADLSYIIHNPDIQPLLNMTLQNQKLKEKVLFGTDFYVVRNHKSEKNMLACITDQLSESEFDQIARYNPQMFLQNSLVN